MDFFKKKHPDHMMDISKFENIYLISSPNLNYKQIIAHINMYI